MERLSAKGGKVGLGFFRQKPCFGAESGPVNVVSQ
jgi:hypothetical protein